MARGSPSTAHRRPDRPPHHDPVPASYAAIDLGPNNCRPFVALPAPGGLPLNNGFSSIVAPAAGWLASGVLCDHDN